MKHNTLFTLTLATALLPLASRADETNRLSFDVSFYGLAAGMSGDAAVKGVPAHVEVDFDKIWDHLNFGAMGSARVNYGRWALSTEVIYMDLEANQNSVSAQFEQWLVQPALEYRFSAYVDAYAGARYNNLHIDIQGPGGRSASGTQDWWDPMVGLRLSVPLGNKFSFNVTGDIGGFGLGSDLTWQAFPFLNWQISKAASMQLGYRFLYTDYETGSGATRFQYDILTSGPQIGFSVHF